MNPYTTRIVRSPSEWARHHVGHESNPQVTVSARQDKVLYGPKGEELIRIEDRPVGFRSGIRRHP